MILLSLISLILTVVVHELKSVWSTYFNSFKALQFLNAMYKFRSILPEKTNLHCCCAVDNSCPTLSDPRDCSTPGFPVPHHLLELVQTHIHWASDAIQPSHPLLPPSPPAFSLCQHQGLFQQVTHHISGQSIDASASASVLQMNIQDWFPLGLTGLISLQSKGLSRVFSSTTVRRH